MDALILGITTAVITPTATLIGVWLGSRSSLTAQRELLAAQELKRQQELVSEVIVLSRKMIEEHALTLPIVLRMNEKDMLEWVDADSAVEQRQTKAKFDLAVSRATHTLNDQNLASKITKLGSTLALDADLMSNGSKGSMADGRKVVLQWHKVKAGEIDALESAAREALRPPHWLKPESLQSARANWWKRIFRFG